MKNILKITILFTLAFIAITTQIVYAEDIEEQILNANAVSMYGVQTVVDEMDTVTFGSYPQSSTSYDKVEPIEWIVLVKDSKNHKALLFSKYILDNVSFNDEDRACTWEDSNLRKWMNGTFYDKAFNADEKNKIVPDTHISDRLSTIDNEVTDNVFLLADFEVRKYFRQYDMLEINKRLATKGTNYAKNVDNKNIKLWVRENTGEHTYSTSDDGSFLMERIVERSGDEALRFDWCIGNSFYWLRTNGINLSSVTRVASTGGLINESNYSVVNAQGGVRPAIWVEYNKGEEKEYDSDKLVEDMTTYTMGKFTQFADAKTSSWGEQPIEWVILYEDKKNNSALLISKYILESRRGYNRGGDGIVTWENSSVRKWLNDTFYNDAFTDEEKKMIETVKLTNEDNDDYLTLGGRDTEDKIFLLSIAEAKKYFPSDRKEDDKDQLGRFAATRGTDYARNRFLRRIRDDKRDEYEEWTWENSPYFLRSPGGEQDRVAVVEANAHIYTGGERASSQYTGIRPAMWIKYKSK